MPVEEYPLKGVTAPVQGLVGPRGFGLLEVVVGISLILLVVGLSVPRYVATMTRRRVQNAAFLVANDLRFARQLAVGQAGQGPRVEFCIRSDGYDVYPVLFEDSMARLGARPGSIAKTARAGQDFSQQVSVTAVGGAGPCLGGAGPDGTAVGFLGSGRSSSGAVTIELAAGGHRAYVDIEPESGRVTVRRQ